MNCLDSKIRRISHLEVLVPLNTLSDGTGRYLILSQGLVLNGAIFPRQTYDHPTWAGTGRGSRAANTRLPNKFDFSLSGGTVR